MASASASGRPARRARGPTWDEPANGLDPEVHPWMRRLRDHAERGGTVLLSSHLLAEVERIADGWS
ncbi:hypothetical protein GCM10020218_107180 [Dactylosporangium vinaceum]